MSGSCGGSCGTQQGGTCGSGDARLAQQDLAINRSLGRIKNKILVMSGKGGVGKSTVAVNLALGLAARGHKVGLMDVDLHGPDVCRMLNLNDQPSVADEKTGLVAPLECRGVKVVSLESLMQDRDEAIIWRGPLKIGVIRQFIADMDWGELDYLVVDAPPGTGDEPLSVAQNIPGVQALVVTTPQEVALADVRKSINFCKTVNMPVVGLVENMSGFVCPHCGETADIFGSGGGKRTAEDFDLPFLGAVPMDARVASGGDAGAPFLSSDADSPAVAAFAAVVDQVEKRLPPGRAVPPIPMAGAVGGSCSSCGG